MSDVVPSGCARGETDPSGFSTIEPERLSEPGPGTSATPTAMLPAGFEEVANTGRAAPECAGTVTLRDERLEAWRNDAWTPACGASVSANARSCAVKFWSVTTNARWSV